MADGCNKRSSIYVFGDVFFTMYACCLLNMSKFFIRLLDKTIDSLVCLLISLNR